MELICERVDPPVDAMCLICGEDIAAEDDGIYDGGGSPFHRACFLRLTIGSLAHQLKLCTCFIGGSKVAHEPAWMSKRQAAEEAVKFFEGRHELTAAQLKAMLIEGTKR